MVEEAYVSFETAKLLKEKGFNEECFALYNPDGVLIQSGIRLNNIQVGRVKGSYSAPTQQTAMRWLREAHNIHIDICSNWDAIHWLYQVFIITPRTARNSYVDKILYTSYEQAVETNIKYCLENLI